MRGGKLTKLAVFALLGAAVAAVLRSLRGEPTPVFSNHPTVTGGPTAVPRVSEPEPKTEPALKPAAAPKVAPKPKAEVATAPKAAPKPKAETAPKADAPITWVLPVDSECPDGFPVKAKVKSGIYHAPGSNTYERTKPDRCYPSVEAAEADGLRAPKR